EKTPFHMLSDGVRTMLAMVMEIAFRCYILNPHLKEQASKETTGVVLIDEIDLHLHPAWQKKVLRDLRIAFPSIQFIVTTHAPLVLGSVKDGKIISIKDNQAFDFPLQHGKDANYILNEMGTSEMDNLLKDNLKDYFILIEKGMGKEEEA
ncbi:MAG: AAA family ATPase, partial [Tannerellaceae bacterium]